MITEEGKNLLIDLADKWEKFAQAETPPNDYERGIMMGFELATSELRALMKQFERTNPLKETQSTIKIAPDDKEKPDTEWEYIYVSFEQAPDGRWRIKHVNGVWQPHWQDSVGFDEAIRRLSQQGWKLARFANGIHVFRRTQEDTPTQPRRD